jgi:flagellar M-ring protein FliF
MASFNDLVKQAKQFWESRDKRQKSFLAAGGAATVLLLALFASLISGPNYKPLSTGLDADDAQALGAQLDAQGIPHQTSADGKTISVPADKLDAARMQIAAQGAPHSGQTGFELFDKMTWGQTEFDERVTYQRALEGELERSIETLSDVKSARVHLVMPTDSVYEDKQRPGKASVILTLRGNGLPKEAVLAIQRLVSGAVDELSPDDVSIIDADSDRSLGLGHDGLQDGQDLETTLSQRLIRTLEPVVGQDEIRADVNIDYDQSSSEVNKETYDPSVSALLNDQKSEEQVTGGGLAGVPGTSSNVPSAKQAKAASTIVAPSSTQSSKSETAQYGVNKVVTRTEEPAGRIQRMSVAILVDDAMVKNVVGNKVSFTRRKRSLVELNKIQQLAEAAIGFDAKRGDTISVENMSFGSNAEDVPDLSWPERAQKAAMDYASILRPVSLLVMFLLAYLFVLRPIQKQAFGPGEGVEAALGAGVRPGQLAVAAAEAGASHNHANQLREHAIDLIKHNPANTTRAVQAWLREES